MTTQISSVTSLADLEYSAINGLSYPSWMNDSGTVVGTFRHESSQLVYSYTAVFWQGGVVTTLAAASGYAYSGAEGINDQGQIVGYVETDTSIFSEHAALWQNGTVTILDDQQDFSVATAINDQGQVVGMIQPAGVVAIRAFVWQNGTLTYLAPLPGASLAGSIGDGGVYSSACAINGAGQIVGWAENAQGVDHPVLWQNGQITDLAPQTPNQTGEAWGINKAGQIVGEIGSSAFLWQNGTMTTVPSLNGYALAVANSINDQGIIVGSASQNETSGSGRAVIWLNGVATDLNSLLPASYLGGTLVSAASINDNDQILATDGHSNYVLTLGTGMAGLTAASAIRSFGEGAVDGPVPVVDSAANVQTDLDALQTIAAAGLIGSITLTDSNTPVLTVSPSQLAADSSVLEDIQGSYSLSVTGPVSAASLTSISGLHLKAVTITDSAADIVANLQNVEGVADAGVLTSIQLNDPATPTLIMNDFQIRDASRLLAAISGPFQIELTNVLVAGATTEAALPHVSSLIISDSGEEVGYGLDSLQALAQAGQLKEIDLLSNGTNIPTVTLDAAQLKDTAALAKISGNYVVEISAPNFTSETVTGLAGHGNSVQFNNDASQFNIVTAGSTVTVQGTVGITDQFNDIQELQFDDYSAFIAQAPGGNGQVTTGNITELYSAVLARKPDLAGLSFYQTYLQANPNTPLLQFAEWFLASPEYVGNTAHDYAQTTAGETQFITDSYQNLLNRTPSAAEISYYLNLIQPALANLTPGTAAYAAADSQAHAQVLVYFSASPEFLSDVQVTAQSSASAQHWLVLV